MTLGKKALRSTIFVAASTYFNMALNMVVSIVLARLLLPEHFGILALALFFLELFGRVREFGFDQALIHKQDNLEKARITHFFLHTVLATLSLLLIIVASPILKHFYDPKMVDVLMVLGVLFLFKAGEATQRITLEKELMFGYVTVIDTLAIIIASAAAILMAWRGFGVWSLVVANSGQYVVSFAVLWVIRPWRPRLSFEQSEATSRTTGDGFSTHPSFLARQWRAATRSGFTRRIKTCVDKSTIKYFLTFGWYLWLGGLTTFILFKYNDFIAGTFLSAAVLGFYAKAFNLAQLPTSVVTSVVSRVALPTYSKVQKDPERLARSFGLVLRNIVRLTIPLSLFLYYIAPEFVGLVLGEKWLPMVPIFRLLVVYAMLRAVFDDAGAFLTAIGKPNIVSRYLGIQAGTILFTTPILVYIFGVNGAALSLDLVLFLGVILAYFYVSKEVEVDYFSIFGRSVLIGLLGLLSIFLSRLLFVNSETWSLLAFKTIFFALLYIGLSILIEFRQIKEDFSYLWKQFRR